jgi:hypothetical protein
MNERQILTIASVCHEANRAWCIHHGDYSQKPWSEAEQWQKDSAIRGVEFAIHGATPEQQHDAWMQDKRRDGWVYGPIKDPAKKEHPCMVPYDQLPIEQRAKDEIFIGMVAAFKQAFIACPGI